MKKKINLKYYFAFLMLFIVNPLFVFAADTGGDIDPKYLSNLMGYVLLGMGIAIIILALFYLIRLFNAVVEDEKRMLYKEKGIEMPVKVAKPSFLSQLYKKATDAVPIDHEEDVMLDHNYDGIKELDNSLPPWWLAMFYITIVFGVWYVGYYHFSESGILQEEEYAIEMKFAEEQKARFLAKQANAVNESNVIALTSADAIAAGKAIYTTSCVACHGTEGEGGVGPNFADKYWIHGGDIKSIFKTIKYGVPEKGMISWQSQLRPSAMNEVASYILTFQGTTPSNPKAPEGDLIEE